MVCKARLALVFALTLLIVSSGTLGASSASPLTKNPRVFYFASTGSLSTARPSSASTPSSANLTRSPVTFSLQPTLTSATILGELTFSVWTNGKWNASSSVSLLGTFSYRLPGQPSWTNATSAPYPIAQGVVHTNITSSIVEIPLLEATSISVGISVTSLPRNATITLNWGSSLAPSFVVLPLSGYETLFGNNPISILDRNGIPTTYFNLNASPGNNIVLVKTLASSALGFQDILKVNMTIADSNNRPVRGASNITMQPSPPNPSAQPYEYVASWVYPSTSAQGTYQVWVDIIDVQGNVAFSFRGPASFGLVPPGFIPPPYSLIPYFAVPGAAVVSGVVYYRRRKRKSYLVPFDHFNTLTGGQIDGGTVVTIEGNTGSGKTILSEQLMFEDLRNGRPCVFVATGDFPNNIRENMKIMGLDVSGYEQSGILTFVDGYSAEAGQESREKIVVPSLRDLTTLGMKITSALPSASFKGGSLYFDSLSPLASKARPESIVSFVQSVGAKVRGLSGRAFFTIGPGIDTGVQRQLEDTADCIVEMEAFEETGTRKRRLRIAKFRARRHQEGWVLFTIEGGKGIIFYSRKPKE